MKKARAKEERRRTGLGTKEVAEVPESRNAQTDNPEEEKGTNERLLARVISMRASYIKSLISFVKLFTC